MHPTCRRALAALCTIAIVPAALAQQSTPADAGRVLSLITRPQSPWPETLPQSRPGESPAIESAGWSADEIAQARTRCAALLDGLDLVAIPHAPIREGQECGAPAPMQLVSIGSNPQIAFSPPPVLTCEMVAALHRWLERDVQPLARTHLGAPIVGVATMSSFSCRAAYGRAKGRLSEHGRVNALDIGGFLTAQGQTAMLVADWGPIASEIVAQAIAADAAAEQKQAKTAKRPQPTPPPTVQPIAAAVAFEFPAVIIGEPAAGSSTALGWAPPSRVGGPKPAEDAPSTLPDGSKGLFLRAIHQAACGIFATVLGPEANKAHRNHFHLDMAERKSASICK